MGSGVASNVALPVAHAEVGKWWIEIAEKFEDLHSMLAQRLIHSDNARFVLRLTKSSPAAPTILSRSSRPKLRKKGRPAAGSVSRSFDRALARPDMSKTP